MKKRTILTLGLCLLLSIGSMAQDNKSKVDLSKEIKLEGTIRHGVLDNGMKYFIKANKTPEKKAEFQIATNAGSVLETEEQVGLAHFTEHMAFNGTFQYPGNSMIDELQKEGITFGRDINAYTGFDQTVFTLTVPTDRPEMINAGLKVLGGWANGILMAGKQIDDERGVIIEEWRLGQGASDRIRAKTFPVILKGSKYANRLPIGTLENLQTFKYETIREFYKTWYRPDNQALIIVGDFDADEMEQMVKDYFNIIPVPCTPLNRPTETIPDNDEPLFVVATDKEAGGSSFIITYKHPGMEMKTVGDFRQQALVMGLYEIMLDERFSELEKKKNCPFMSAGSGFMNSFIGIGRDISSYVISGSAKEGKIMEAMNKALEMNKQVYDHGFLQSELDRAKDVLLDRYENASKRANKVNSSAIAEQLVDYFLDGNPMPGARWEYRTAKALMDGITLEEVNALAKQWITEKNIVGYITMTEAKGVKIPTDAQAIKAIKNFWNIKTKPYVDTYKEVEFLAQEPKAGKIVKEEKNEKFDYTTLTLSNGAKVILKPTDFKDNEIIFQASSKGGSSLYADNEMINVNFAANIIDQCGIGNMNMTQLQKFLAKRSMGLTPFINDLTEGFNGSCAPKDLEAFMQYLYMFYTCPRKDAEVLDVQIDKLKTQISAMKDVPEVAFSMALTKTMYPQDKRTIQIPTEKQLKEMNIEKMYKIFRERFSGAADFTFVFTGDFKVNEIKPLIEKYIASIPEGKKNENWVDRSTEFAKGNVDKKVYKGSEQKATVVMVKEMPYDYNLKDNRTMSIMNEILQIRVTEYIREEKGAAYSPYATIDFDRDPKGTATWMGYYGCSIENVDLAVSATEEIFEEFINGQTTEANLAKAKEQLINRRKPSYTTSNGFWAGMMLNNDVLGYDMYSMEEYAEQINSITLEDVQRLAQKYFQHGEFVKVTLLPEQGK